MMRKRGRPGGSGFAGAAGADDTGAPGTGVGAGLAAGLGRGLGVGAGAGVGTDGASVRSSASGSVNETTVPCPSSLVA